MNGATFISPAILDAFAAGVYLLFGVIHLDLWLRRRDRRSHLWLAGVSSGALLVDLTGMALRNLPAATAGWIGALNILGVAVVTTSLLELVAFFTGRPAGRFMRGSELVILAAASPIGVLGLGPLVGTFLLTCVALLFSAMVKAFQASRAGDRESRWIASGILALLASLIADVLMDVGILPMVFGIPIIGFTVLFLATASSLNGRSEREHRELVALRQDLEQRVRDRTRELEDANRRLDEASRTDSLTGLPNRRGFLEASAQELQRSLRSGLPCTVVMADLDHFKEINDRLGHPAGDAVLRDAAALLRSKLRAQDLVGRWGGEEFILLMPDTGVAGAAVAADTLRLALAAHSFEPDGASLTVTASFGAAEHRRDQPFETTVANADRALYRAKEEGRNRVAVAGSA